VLAAKRCATNHNMTKSFAAASLALSFQGTVLTAAGGPRALTAALPAPDSNAARLAPGGLDLAACLQQAATRELRPEAGRRLALLHSNPPERDERTGRGWPPGSGSEQQRQLTALLARAALRACMPVRCRPCPACCLPTRTG
jgi:hypothetical protein